MIVDARAPRPAPGRAAGRPRPSFLSARGTSPPPPSSRPAPGAHAARRPRQTAPRRYNMLYGTRGSRLTLVGRPWAGRTASADELVAGDLRPAALPSRTPTSSWAAILPAGLFAAGRRPRGVARSGMAAASTPPSRPSGPPTWFVSGLFLGGGIEALVRAPQADLGGVGGGGGGNGARTPARQPGVSTSGGMLPGSPLLVMLVATARSPRCNATAVTLGRQAGPGVRVRADGDWSGPSAGTSPCSSP
jgi:hypothetical protein